MRTVLCLTLSLFVVTASVGYAATDPAAKCSDSKAKAAGKKAQSLLKAVGKNIAKNPDTKLAANISKAQSKLTKSFTKAESKGGCFTNGDAATIEAKIDAFVDDVFVAQNCGDNVVQGIEECDGTDDAACPGACLGNCTCDVCGNDTQRPPEECDGTDDAACPGACLGDCTCDVCGNDTQRPPEQCDGTDSPDCPGICQANCLCPVPDCGNGVVEAGEECDGPCSTAGCGVGEICGVTCQCEVELPCDCGSPEPTTMEFENEYPLFPGALGTCGAVKDASDNVLKTLNCSQGNIGGGGISVASEQSVHTGPPSVYNVECCYGTKLAIAGSTAADTGSVLNCTTPGCFQGGPLPVLQSTPAFATCNFNAIEEEARGWVDCASGEVEIKHPIRTIIHLTGDHLAKRCTGGPNPGGRCENAADCLPGGTCDNDSADVQPCPLCNPATLLCNGGPNNGLPCSLGTPDNGLPQFPTSYDCPPPPETEFGFTPLPHVYSTADLSVTEPDGQFCTFCQDKVDEGTSCYEGDSRIACPDSAIIDCKPSLAITTECGNPVRCETDADCFPPFETCTQRTPGALDFTNAVTIEENGEPAGDVRGGAWHPVDWASVTCTPPTYNPFQDNTADFPSSGAFSLSGMMRLRPSPSGAFVDRSDDVLD